MNDEIKQEAKLFSALPLVVYRLFAFAPSFYFKGRHYKKNPGEMPGFSLAHKDSNLNRQNQNL